MRPANLVVLGNTASVFLALLYTVCFAFDMAFPQWAMADAWRALLPGFEGIDARSYAIGLAWAYGYGWFFAVAWATLYNFFDARGVTDGEAP